VDLVLSFCRWDWPADCAGDRGAGFTAALAEGEDVEQGVGAALGIRDANLAGALTIESTVWQYMRMSLADCSALLETITAQREEYLVQRDNASSDELLFPWLLLNMVIELRSSDTEDDEAPRAGNALLQSFREEIRRMQRYADIVGGEASSFEDYERFSRSDTSA
jgi:hypothetical protein